MPENEGTNPNGAMFDSSGKCSPSHRQKTKILSAQERGEGETKKPANGRFGLAQFGDLCLDLSQGGLQGRPSSRIRGPLRKNVLPLQIEGLLLA